VDPAEVQSQFDVVMAHHSFEHMPDPHQTIEQLRRLALKRIVIAVPVPGFGWREYGVNWVALDPPRHLHLLTPEAMHRLADAHDLHVTHMYFVPDSMSLWASEQYAADIPLRDRRSYHENPNALTGEQVAEYDRRAWEISGAEAGDAAVFLLEPK
jgi:SAM-dependent methyltransferase